jgi:hypothetical protein
MVVFPEFALPMMRIRKCLKNSSTPFGLRCDIPGPESGATSDSVSPGIEAALLPIRAYHASVSYSEREKREQTNEPEPTIDAGAKSVPSSVAMSVAIASAVMASQ